MLWTRIALGQDSGVYPLSAWLKMPSNPDAFQVNIHEGPRGATATMSLPGQTQRRLVNLSSIESIYLVHPPAVLEALEVIDKQDDARADLILKTYSSAVLPFLSIPENNVAPLLDRYEHSLHLRNQTVPLRELYAEIARMNEEFSFRNAEAWLAYLEIRDGKTGTANDSLFSDSSIQPEAGAPYFLQQMALCRKQMAGGDFRSAIDHAARVIALGTIEDALYPEALYVSAQCYDGLADGEQARLEEERAETLRKELVAERVRVALALEAAAEARGLPPPTEAFILESVDPEAVNSRIPPVPPRSENHFALIAQQLYLFTEQVFPATYWGKAAADGIWPETRDKKTNDLKNFSLSEVPK